MEPFKIKFVPRRLLSFSLHDIFIGLQATFSIVSVMKSTNNQYAFYIKLYIYTYCILCLQYLFYFVFFTTSKALKLLRTITPGKAGKVFNARKFRWNLVVMSSSNLMEIIIPS